MLNQTIFLNIAKQNNEVIEDFEVFDLRDGLNVAAYSIMSSSKLLFVSKRFS